jgi:hypothetical protein
MISRRDVILWRLEIWKITGSRGRFMTRDGAVDTTTGYGLDGRGVGVRFPVRAGFFFADHSGCAV